MTDVHALQDAEQRAKIERHVRKNSARHTTRSTTRACSAC